MKFRSFAAISLLAGSSYSASSQSPSCPNDILIMKTGLAVNPDGAAASYAPGDRGFTDINNGVNLIDNGVKRSCVTNSALCREKWAQAEAGSFAKGTPEFCSFAIAAAPIAADGKLTGCENKKGRFIIGNGKGRPAPGSVVKNVEGKDVITYLSTTSLTHSVNGETRYVDSSKLPGIVVPTSRPELVGSLAWVEFGEFSTFAIVSDTGPAFGEGSVALHEVLRYGALQTPQPIGPILVAMRCGPAETLKAPFQSRPDLKTDKCKPGYVAKTISDIRAYSGIESGVTTVILKNVKPPMKGWLSQIELTTSALEKTAQSAGYDAARLATLAKCKG